MLNRKIKLMNVWDTYMPGQLIEPHDYFNKLSNWESFTCGAKVSNYRNSDTHIVGMVNLTANNKVKNEGPIRKIIRKMREFLLWQRFNKFTYLYYQKIQPDLMLFHFGTTAAMMLPLMQKINKPKAVIFYGVDASAALKKIKWINLYHKLFKIMDLYIVLSETVKTRLVQIGCPENKILVWNLPAEIENYPLIERQAHFKNDKTRFICAARFVEKKGHFLLLQAFRQVLNKHANAELTLIGYGGQKSKIEQFITDLKLNHAVKIIDTQMRPNFHELYYSLLKEHDIFVLPSIEARDGDDEGGPALTLVCAQAAGLPVICTPFVGSEISVIEGHNGVYCKMNDFNSLAERMLYMMEHRELWSDYGQNGSKTVGQLFSKSVQNTKLEEVFRALATRAKNV